MGRNSRGRFSPNSLALAISCSPVNGLTASDGFRNAFRNARRFRNAGRNGFRDNLARGLTGDLEPRRRRWRINDRTIATRKAGRPKTFKMRGNLHGSRARIQPDTYKRGGAQRGTSRKEDVLDTVISLSRPPGYSATEGARFEVRFTKSRGFWGRDAEPFEACFAEGTWSTAEIVAEDSDEALAALREQGLSIRDIADRSGISKSEVQRRLKGGES